MPFYDWSLSNILVTYTICSWFKLVLYDFLNHLFTCSHIRLVIKWHFWCSGYNLKRKLEFFWRLTKTYNLNMVVSNKNNKIPWRCDKVGIFFSQKSFVKVALQQPHSFFFGVFKWWKISKFQITQNWGKKEKKNSWIMWLHDAIVTWKPNESKH